MSETSRFFDDWEKRDKEGRWLAGPKITKDDLKTGSDEVELMTAEQWWQSARSAKSPQTVGLTSKPISTLSKVKIMTFGKHRGKLMADVKEEDPGYWHWCLREISGFKEKAGDLVDED